MSVDTNNDASLDNENDCLWTLIADVRHWLEWQSECGAVDWAVEDWTAWTKPIQRTQQSAAPAYNRAIQNKSKAPDTVEQTKSHTPHPPAPVAPDKPKTKIPSAWQNIIENAAPVLNVAALSTGDAGLQSVREFQRSYCQSNTPCQIGFGNIHAPVLIIAGDKSPMKADGFKMLSNMREHVLKLSKSQLYFMDYPTRGSGQAQCHQKLCHQIFHGLLRAQSPKFILVMGEACALELFGSQGRPVMGEVGELRCLGTVDQPIQAVWTHHPHFLLDHGHEKRTVMRHLQNVRRLLMKQGLQ